MVAPWGGTGAADAKHGRLRVPAPRDRVTERDRCAGRRARTPRIVRRNCAKPVENMCPDVPWNVFVPAFVVSSSAAAAEGRSGLCDGGRRDCRTLLSMRRRHRIALGLLLVACKKTDVPPDADPPVAYAAAPRDPSVCSREFPSDAELLAAPEGTSITIRDFFARNPRKGRFTVEGFVQHAFHCAPCPPGAMCKPCEETVILSDSPDPHDGPSIDGVDFPVSVPDARRFVPRHRYRMTVVMCANGPMPPRPADRELRGYREVTP